MKRTKHNEYLKPGDIVRLKDSSKCDLKECPGYRYGYLKLLKDRELILLSIYKFMGQDYGDVVPVKPVPEELYPPNELYYKYFTNDFKYYTNGGLIESVVKLNSLVKIRDGNTMIRTKFTTMIRTKFMIRRKSYE